MAYLRRYGPRKISRSKRRVVPAGHMVLAGLSVPVIGMDDLIVTNGRKSPHTQRAYREDVMAFVRFMGGRHAAP